MEHRRGGAHELHHREPGPSGRQLLVHEIDRPAVVLGSAQRIDGLDVRAASRGLEVARRRSGGGAVVLHPGDHLWIDVVIPAGDVLWDDDVERATWWLGETWARILDALTGSAHAATVYRRGVSDRPLGRLACFAAYGPGEVALDGRKVVGISQRRTRSYARFQCVLFTEWDPSMLLHVVGGGGPGSASHAAALREALEQRAGAVPALPGWSAVEELRANLP